MDEAIVAILVFCFSGGRGYAIWSRKNDHDFWTPEAIRQRSRNGLRLIVFVPSVMSVFLFSGWHSLAGRKDGLSAIFFALVAFLARPDWLRRKSPVNPPAPNPDARS